MKLKLDTRKIDELIKKDWAYLGFDKKEPNSRTVHNQHSNQTKS